MKTVNFLFAAAVGALAYHIWRKSTEKSAGKQLTAEEQAQVVADVIVGESQKYSDVLKKQYDIIMPSDLNWSNWRRFHPPGMSQVDFPMKVEFIR